MISLEQSLVLVQAARRMRRTWETAVKPQVLAECAEFSGHGVYIIADSKNDQSLSTPLNKTFSKR